MRRLVLKLHLIVATVAGIFIVILGLTGSVMAFETELMHTMHSDLWHVAPGGTALPLVTLGEAATRAVPNSTVSGYSLSTSPDLSYQVAMRGRTVYINQYTGAILGVVSPGPDLLSRIHQLHLRLLWRDERDRGKTIMSWAGVAAFALTLSGLYLWWPTKRWRIRGGSSTRTWLDLHHVVGVVSLALLMILAVTGCYIGFDELTVPWTYRVTDTKPALMYAPQAPMHSSADGRRMLTPDEALTIARAGLPGAMPVSVNVPSPAGVYSIAARYPEDRTPGGRSRILIDPYSGQVLAAEGSRSAPLGSRIVTLNRAIHTGDVVGLPSKIVMSLTSLAVVVQAISGLVIWWRKAAKA